MSFTITNNKGLPQPVVDAIAYNEWSPSGSMGIRKIVDPPQMGVLKRANNIEVDASEMVYAIRRKAMMHILENGSRNERMRRATSVVNRELGNLLEEINDHGDDRFASPQEKEAYIAAIRATITDLDTLLQNEYPSDPNWLFNQNFAISFDKIEYTIFKGTDREEMLSQGITLDCDIAMYDKGKKELWYIVECDVEASYAMELRKSWVIEANLQAAIMRVNGYPVQSIMVMMWFKNWKKGRMLTSRQEYPSSSTMVMPLEVKDHQKTIAFMKERAVQYLRADAGDVPECTRADRWEGHPEYVVLRPFKGDVYSQRPLKKAVTKDEALTWVAQNRHRYHDAYVEMRTGPSKRCESYCPVRDVCKQAAKINAAKAKYAPLIGGEKE